MADTFKCVFVNPHEQQVIEHEFTNDAMDAFLKERIGDERDWNVLMSPSHGMNGVQFCLHDWAVCQIGQRYFRLPPYPHPLGGPVLFVGFDEEGVTASVPDGFFDLVRRTIEWCPKTMRFVRFDNVQEQYTDPNTGLSGTRTIRTVVYEGEKG